MSVQTFAERFGGISDEAWLEILIRSVKEPVIEGVEFPRFPDEKMQSSFVGSAGRATLEEAFVFYQDIRRYGRQLGITLNQESRVLDFGCGWGRHYRFFLRELKPGNYVGIDIDEGCIATCRRTIPMGSFEPCAIEPPVRFEAGSLDVVYAYSVFSHLSERTQLAWIREFGRILRPGGMLVVTTLKREHLGVWLRLSQDESKPWWKEKLRQMEFDHDRFLASYGSGKFLYCPTGGGGVRSDDFYGEAIVSPSYIQQNWSKDFRIVEHLNDRNHSPQALIVCQKHVSA